MGCIYIYRAVVIECRIISHTGSYTGHFYLSLGVDSRRYGMPSQLHYRTVCHGVNPSFIDGMCHTVYVEGSGRRFQVRIIAVEQLVPETVFALTGSQSANVCLQQVDNLIASGIVGRKYIQYFTHGKNSPSVGTSPVESRMIFHTFYPSMTEQAFFRYEHALCKLQYLAYSFLIIFVIVVGCIASHQSNRGDAHEHVVQPQCVVVRTVTGKCAVGQTMLFVHDEMEVIVNHVLQFQAFVFHLCLHHCRTYGSCIIQGVRSQNLKHLCIGCTVFFIYFLKVRSYFR